MIISIVKSKKQTHLGITPEFVSVLSQNHYTVLIEGRAEEEKMRAYLNVGGYIINAREELLDRGDLIIKLDAPDENDIEYAHGETKMFFAKSAGITGPIIKQMLAQKISFINYSDLPGFANRAIDERSNVEFSNCALPFVLKLAAKGMRALVDDETLREALVLMSGKMYHFKLASRFGYPCYEF
ncbi:MAG: hypothetical protein HY564_01830 [Candidatus Jacksonbacteria bacterium]|nr:hypothetical protein [Candidatus Jacksonbacteria bacterium]